MGDVAETKGVSSSQFDSVENSFGLQTELLSSVFFFCTKHKIEPILKETSIENQTAQYGLTSFIKATNFFPILLDDIPDLG